jgi:hypothetical protein
MSSFLKFDEIHGKMLFEDMVVELVPNCMEGGNIDSSGRSIYTQDLEYSGQITHWTKQYTYRCHPVGSQIVIVYG